MEGLDRIVAAHDRVVGEAGAQETAQNFSSCECCCECCCEKCCESLGATSSSSRKKGATKMRNEEPTRCYRPNSLTTTVVRSARIFEDRVDSRSEEHTSELQSLRHLVCRLLLEKK